MVRSASPAPIVIGLKEISIGRPEPIAPQDIEEAAAENKIISPFGDEPTAGDNKASGRKEREDKKGERERQKHVSGTGWYSVGRKKKQRPTEGDSASPATTILNGGRPGGTGHCF